MIKKIKGKYVVLSEKTGRSFGSYATKAEAEHRLGQVEMFKHMKSGGAKRQTERSRIGAARQKPL
jgi:hypothetical protein